MPGIGWIVMGGAVGAFVLWRILKPSLDGAVQRAIAAEDLQPILEAIEKRSTAAQPAGYNHAIRRLWDSYQRPMALELVRELAKNHGTTNIAQYWIKQVMVVEPALAKKGFSKDFLDTYFQPEVAAQCGPVG